MSARNVAGLVRGLRENPNSPEYMSMILAEIKSELKSTNARVKTNAFLKLGYLSMLGVDMSMAHLAIIEIMSSSAFTLKRPAMFVASLAFKNKSDLTLLTTNIFLKELASPNYLEVGMALSCICAICTDDIANGVVGGLLPLTTHSRAYVRKKLCLTFFKVCEKSPSLYVQVFPKLKDMCSDADMGVQSAAINAFLEIAKRNTKLVTPMIPVFFHFLKEIKNNWLLIKLLKLLEHVCRVEPRMWSKLTSSEVLIELAGSTKAKSVQIELTRFVLRAGAVGEESEEERTLTDQAMGFLVDFLDSTDNNIRFIAVSIAGDMMERKPAGNALAESLKRHEEQLFQHVIKSIDSADTTLRRSALRAAGLMVPTSESATRVVQQLLALFAKNEANRFVQLDFVKAVVAISPQLLKDTEWYLRILVLLGSEACVDPSTADIIVERFKQVCAQRDAATCLKVSVAAVLSDKLPSHLVAACAWTIGKFSFRNWPHDQFTPASCALLVQKLYDHCRHSSAFETQVDCVWGALKLVVAFRLNNPGDSGAYARLATGVSNETLKLAGASIGLTEVSGLVISTLKFVEAGEHTDEDIVDLLFAERQVFEVATPDNMDEPMIELPPSLKVHHSAHRFEPDTDAAYTDTEEEEGPPQPLSMFSIDSLLRN